MTHEYLILCAAAASIGFFHTLIGPDHYVPFIALSKARGWSSVKTAWITALCGIGHVAGSVVLGLIGVLLGLAVTRLEIFEAVRGDWAAWVLIGFGLAYTVYGIRSAVKNKPHTHSHAHTDGVSHDHHHCHQGAHTHVHEKRAAGTLTPWALFIVFVLGPCEPLIPILMYPAAKQSLPFMVVVALVFGVVTVATMMGMVFLCLKGIRLLPAKRLERYAHALAGVSILVCGVAIQLGL